MELLKNNISLLVGLSPLIIFLLVLLCYLAKIAIERWKGGSMMALTKEQKEYMDFKESQDKIYQIFIGMQKGDHIPQCVPRSKTTEHSYYNNYVESLCHDYIDMLAGNHNDFLKHIIERSEERNK